MECEMSESLRTESVATLQFKKNKCKRLNDLRTSLTLVGTFERAKWTLHFQFRPGFGHALRSKKHHSFKRNHQLSSPSVSKCMMEPKISLAGLVKSGTNALKSTTSYLSHTLLAKQKYGYRQWEQGQLSLLLTTELDQLFGFCLKTSIIRKNLSLMRADGQQSSSTKV